MNSQTAPTGVSVDGVTKRYGKASSLALDHVDLRIAPGEMLAILGPSGSGKSTLLNVLAGLEDTNSGRVSFGDRDVTELPAERRHVAVVFQSSMLYPHLTLRQSISFAVRMQKVPNAEVTRRIEDVTGWLHIDHLLERKPHEVSGGERQRAAVAKALVSQPALLLMDEPFSAVDAQLRRQMRTELVKLHRRYGTTTVFITHDQEEAMGIADRVAVMRNGRLLQVDDPLTLYRQPATSWLADFVGVHPFNLVRVRLDAQRRTLRGCDGELVLRPPALSLPDTFDLGVRPEHLRLQATASSPFRIFTRELIGGQVKYTVRSERGNELVAVCSDSGLLDPDMPVEVSVEWPHALAFEAMDDGARLKVEFREAADYVS